MNSWNRQQNQNSGQAQFNPYWGNLAGNYNATGAYGRAPVYHAEPIQGENAAWAFPIGGGDIWLPDADQDVIWWIRVDQNGNKQVKPFDIKPHEEPVPVDMNSLAEKLDAALARLDSMEEKVNAKFNKSNAKRSADPTAAAVD